MPLYPDIRPDWLKPENKSVLDSPVKKAVRGLVDLAGGNDSAEQVMGGPSELTAPVAAPLVSFYKNAVEGSPARRAREWATSAFLERAKRLYPEHVAPAIEALVKRYPRVAAHAKLAEEIPGASSYLNTADAYVNWNELIQNQGPLGLEGARFPMKVNPQATRGAASPDLLAHEMTHIAQRLGNKDAPQLYSLMSTGLELHPALSNVPESRIADAAYQQNPFERSARQVAMRKTGKANLTHMPEINNVPQSRPLRTRVMPVGESIEKYAATDPKNQLIGAAANITKARKTGTPLEGLRSVGDEVIPASKDSWKHINDFRQGKDIRLSLDPGKTPELPSATGNVKLLGRGHNTRGNPKLRPEAVRYIKEMAAAGQPEAELAKQFGVTVNTIQQMLRGESWVKSR